MAFCLVGTKRITLAVAGSQEFTDCKYVNGVLDNIGTLYVVDKVVSDGTPGVGEIVQQWAALNDIRLHEYSLDKADVLVAFPTPTSREVWECIRHASVREIPYHTFNVY